MVNGWGNKRNSEKLYFWDSKITADGDWSHEIKIWLLLGRKAMTNIDTILKSRDITLQTKVHIVKAVVFSVVMYGCKSWTIKKTEHQRIDAFKLWCRRRLLTVPWTAMRSNQSILREINTEYSLEELMLKLKFQHFCQTMQKPTHWKNPRFWERLRAEEEGWDGWMASPMQRTWTWANFGNWWGAGRPHGCKELDTTGWLNNNNGL